MESTPGEGQETEMPPPATGTANEGVSTLPGDPFLGRRGLH